MYKILSVFFFVPFFCCAEVNGNVEICTTAMNNYRIQDGDFSKSFTTYGPEVKGEIYFTGTNRLRIEPKFLYMWGNRASISEESLAVGYHFHPKENLIIKPYIGIKHLNVTKNVSVRFHEHYEYPNCRIVLKTLNGIMGCTFTSFYSEKLRFKFDCCVGYGPSTELFKIPRELHNLVMTKFKIPVGFADLGFEIDYRIKKGTYFIAKIGSRATMNKYDFGYGSNYLSLGYRLCF